jgi:hypothetical protein
MVALEASKWIRGLVTNFKLSWNEDEKSPSTTHGPSFMFLEVLPISEGHCQ